MKALSLTQPWATLVAIGAKRIETRSWATFYRGPVAIHAAKAMPGWAKDTLHDPTFRGALAGRITNAQGETATTAMPLELPRGYVLATAQLVDVIRMELLEKTRWAELVTDTELAFGDYRAGRYAWILEDVAQLERPIIARGSLGLWEWNRP